jgi:hypothetical protein
MIFPDEYTSYTDMNKIAKKAKGYCCPSCGAEHGDNKEGYNIGGEYYPQYFNDCEGATMDGTYHDWDELHKCIECGIKFWFSNGAY